MTKNCQKSIHAQGSISHVDFMLRGIRVKFMTILEVICIESEQINKIIKDLLCPQ